MGAHGKNNKPKANKKPQPQQPAESEVKVEDEVENQPTTPETPVDANVVVSGDDVEPQGYVPVDTEIDDVKDNDGVDVSPEDTPTETPENPAPETPVDTLDDELSDIVPSDDEREVGLIAVPEEECIELVNSIIHGTEFKTDEERFDKIKSVGLTGLSSTVVKILESYVLDVETGDPRLIGKRVVRLANLYKLINGVEQQEARMILALIALFKRLNPEVFTSVKMNEGMDEAPSLASISTGFATMNLIVDKFSIAGNRKEEAKILNIKTALTPEDNLFTAGAIEYIIEYFEAK